MPHRWTPPRAACPGGDRNPGQERRPRVQLGDDGRFTHSQPRVVWAFPLRHCLEGYASSHRTSRRVSGRQVRQQAIPPTLSKFCPLAPRLAASPDLPTLSSRKFTSEQHIPTTHEHMIKVRNDSHLAENFFSWRCPSKFRSIQDAVILPVVCGLAGCQECR